MPVRSPAFESLWQVDRLMPLGPGRPNEPMRGPLTRLTAEALFAPARIVRPEFAQACLAGLWLWHDFLDESHRISQDLSSAEGSYWHAIMHRREPDPSNSKYWFRRVGSHPVLKMLVEQCPSLSYKYTNPHDFVEFCELVRDSGSPDEELAKRVQYLEWQLLFDHCYRQAIS